MSKPEKVLRSLDDLAVEGFSVEGLDPVIERYDVGVSALMKERIAHANDPIGRQFLPTKHELDILPDEHTDPIGDEAHSPVKGIVHRYPDRVLFKVTNVCRVYCRYCFRRDRIGTGSDHLSASDITAALDYIASHSEIWEVILTGGDPLVLSAKKLKQIFDALADIDHVKIVRLHSRIPVVDPAFINDTMMSVLENFPKQIQIVLHVNHRDEITTIAEEKFIELRRVGCTLFAQSVLLQGVNDTVDALGDLFRHLIASGVKPYYLHHLDRAPGTSQFRISLQKGQALMQALQGQISGPCLPSYVLDVPGGYGKIPVNESYVTHLGAGRYRLRDIHGGDHLYFDGECDD